VNEDISYTPIEKPVGCEVRLVASQTFPATYSYECYMYGSWRAIPMWQGPRLDSYIANALDRLLDQGQELQPGKDIYIAAGVQL
jgi:hypothetical protein